MILRRVIYVGILSAFRLASTPLADASMQSRKGLSSVASPWSEGQLNQFVWNDILGNDNVTVTRAEAMSVPAVAVARSLLLGELAGRPLRGVKGGEVLTLQPAWLTRTDGDLSPWHRMAHTIDDLIFYGQSLWYVNRGTDDQILDATRVPFDRWSVDSEGSILINDRPVDAKSVIYFPGNFEGLVTVASRTIRAAIDIEKSWSGRARNPAPIIILEEKEDHGMTQAEASEYVTAVAQARRNPDGAVMFSPYKLNVRVEGQTATDLMIEARNAVKLDVANFLNIPTAQLDAALPKASLNYETQVTREESFSKRLPYWTNPIEARLSMDDVCPRGQRIAFDMSDLTTAPGGATGAYLED